MPAYLVFDIEVTDPAKIEDYRALAGPAVQKYGGRYLIRGGKWESLEGDWAPQRIVLLEFPSVEQAKKFYDSPEYLAARKARAGAANFRTLVVEGV